MKHSKDPASAFQQHCADDRGGDTLYLPNWSTEDWRRLFGHAQSVSISSGDVLIRHGERERALYFVISGALEVTGRTTGSDALGRLFREQPGSVLGEIALFDGLPRTATVWATEPTVLLRLDFDQMQGFITEFPKLGTDLLFALGRVLAFRLRRSSERDLHNR